MPRVHIIATGGTIAMAQQAPDTGAVVALTGSDLVGKLAGQSEPALPAMTCEEYGRLPSSHFTPDYLWGLRNRVAESSCQADLDGIVVTHGTDTLEETAYLLDLTVPGDKPMVLTGAMRLASEAGYEGIANLGAAVRVAACPAARGLGALVVMNDEIHAARDVTKTDSQSLDTFKSPSWGPLGRVEPGGITIPRRIRRQLLHCTGLEPRVYLFKLVAGMDAELVPHAVKLGARGIVIEAFGSGRVPPWWLQAVEQAIAQGVAVAVSTRCPSGSVSDRYGFVGAYHDLVRAGCLFAEGLNGPKMRLRLMAALGTARNLEGARQLFNA